MSSAGRPPIEMRALAVAAFAAPAAIIVARELRVLLSEASTPPGVALTATGAIAWLAFVATRRGHALALAVCEAAIAHVGALAWVVAALLAAVFAGAPSACALALLAAAALVADRARAKRVAAIVAINAVVLVALDVAVRLWVLPGKSHNNVFVEHDADLGWKLRPSQSLRHETEHFTSRESTNSLGFRTPERPFAKPPGVRRVVVLGDSHSEAYTVDDERTWCAELERLLSRDRPVEVISLGVGGYSTDQELLAYLRHGRRFEPDLVVLQFCENDVAFNVLDSYWRGKKPRFERAGEQLFLTGVPVPNLRDASLVPRELVRASALALLVETMLRQLAIDRAVDVEADVEEGWRVTGLLVRALDELAEADGAELVAFNVSDRQLEVDRRFRAICGERAIPVLEIASMYVDERKTYFPQGDGHWNAKGQAAAAGVLAPQVAAFLEQPRATGRASPAAFPIGENQPASREH